VQKVKTALLSSPVGAFLDPRESLSAAIPAKTIAESISKCRRQLKHCLELVTGKHSPCKYRPILPSVIGEYNQSAWCRCSSMAFFEEAGGAM